MQMQNCYNRNHLPIQEKARPTWKTNPNAPLWKAFIYPPWQPLMVINLCCTTRIEKTQLLLNVVWKVYTNYFKEYPNSLFQEDTLKDRLQECLKKLKMRNSNDEDSNKAMLLNDEVLVHLKVTNGHVMWNMLKRRQNLINRIVKKWKASKTLNSHICMMWWMESKCFEEQFALNLVVVPPKAMVYKLANKPMTKGKMFWLVPIKKHDSHGKALSSVDWIWCKMC